MIPFGGVDIGRLLSEKVFDFYCPYGDDLMRAGTALTLPDKPEAPSYLMGEPEEDERQIYVPYTETSIADPSTPPERRESMARLYPQAEMVVFEGADHTVSLTHREEYYRAIDAFLTG